MASSAHRGTLLLTLAQAYHALTGYFIFITVARLLGQEAYGAFTLVLWTMTTIEVFVVDGVPKAISYHVARLPGASRLLLRRGATLTAAAAAALTALVVLLAPVICDHWERPFLTTALRLSSLDFVAFVGFAVYVQAVNGLHHFGRQASIWFLYSTSKTAVVVCAVALGYGIEGAACGYAIASFMGSVGAWLLGRRPVAEGRTADAPAGRELLRFGLPVSTQALALLSLVNVDLWAAGSCEAPAKTVGAYGGAATLARALFFIFRAFGEALFPAVARHLALDDHAAAQRSVRKGLGLLASLLIPATGLATGAAGTVLTVLFDDPGYGEGAIFLRLLAPAAAAWALTAVLAALISASARPWRIALFLAGLFVVDAVLVYGLSRGGHPEGAAWGALVASLIGLLSAGALTRRALGAIVPWRVAGGALLGAVLLDRTLALWHPASWWVFVYGAALYAAVVGVLLLAGGGATKKRKTPGI